MLSVTIAKKTLHILFSRRAYTVVIGVFALVCCLCAGFTIGLFEGTYNGLIEFSGDPVDELLNDNIQYSIRGNKAIAKSAARGNVSLMTIWNRTDGFWSLSGPRPARIAALLSSMNTALSLAIAQRMWLKPVTFSEERPEVGERGPHISIVPRLVGAYVLTRKHALPEKDIEDLNGLFDIYCKISPTAFGKTYYDILQAQSLLILSLAQTGRRSVSTRFEELLPQLGSATDFPDVLFEACGLLGSPNLILPLRDRLGAWVPTPYDADEEWEEQRNRTMDYGPRILRSLILLGDYTAIDIFLSRCLNSQSSSQEHFGCLNRLTGIYDNNTIAAWRLWYSQSGRTFRLSEDDLCVLREEVIEFGERSLFLYNEVTGLMDRPPDMPFYSLEEIRNLEVSRNTGITRDRHLLKIE